MNAPLPRAITQASSAQAYEQAARATNEVAGRLAARLSTETSGDVHFSLADRGRYATDASIYQVTPVGVFVPRSTCRVAPRRPGIRHTNLQGRWKRRHG